MCILFDSIFLWDPKFQPGGKKKKKKRFPESIKELIRFRGRKSKKQNKSKNTEGVYIYVLYESESCPVVSDSLQPHGL